MVFLNEFFKWRVLDVGCLENSKNTGFGNWYRLVSGIGDAGYGKGGEGSVRSGMSEE